MRVQKVMMGQLLMTKMIMVMMTLMVAANLCYMIRMIKNLLKVLHLLWLEVMIRKGFHRLLRKSPWFL